MINDKILFTLSTELSKDELKMLIDNPELIFEIIESYQRGDQSEVSSNEDEENESYYESDNKIDEVNSIIEEDSNASEQDSDRKKNIPNIPIKSSNAQMNAMAKNKIN